MGHFEAVVAAKFDVERPLDCVEVVSRPTPDVPADWVPVRVKTATVNHHDVWTLRGVLSFPADPPVPLGTDAAGIGPDGSEVIVHSVVATGDDQRLLSEGVNGALAEVVWAPARNLVRKPSFLNWEEAACLPTVWLTAWHMLTSAARALPGEVLLVQGATGGLATAAIQIGVAMGLRVVATSRSDAGLRWAEELGARAVPTGTKLDRKADIIVDGVGAATAEHSQRSLAFGGRWVVAGATTGRKAEIDMSRWFWRQLRLLGVTMGSLDELGQVINFLEATGVRPRIGSVHAGLERTPAALEALLSGGTPGKHVLSVN
jgi:NADPH:quinone reductase-like Zn-dependent oxidoreductase